MHGINWEEARIVVCENWQRQKKAEEEIKSIKNKRDWGGGEAYTWKILCVSNKQVSHKQGNKHVILITRFN